jgi:hypothetical protein
VKEKSKNSKFFEKDFRVTKNKKTEHAGAKNGGGHWGPREEAKALSKKARRADSKEIIENERKDLSKPDCN